MGDTITISKKEYFGLLVSDFELEMLNCAGGDNWQGIDEVNYELLKEFKEEKMKELGINE